MRLTKLKWFLLVLYTPCTMRVCVCLCVYSFAHIATVRIQFLPQQLYPELNVK